jgi:hypothetical protein
MDDAFAGEVRRYSVPGGTLYQNLSRNRTYTGNVIYSPVRICCSRWSIGTWKVLRF